MTKERQPIRERQGRRWFVSGVIAASLIFVLGMGAMLIYPYWHHGRIYPGTFIADVAVGGLTPAEARARVDARIEAYRDQGVEFQGFGRRVTFLPTMRALGDPDLTYDVITYNADASVVNAYGRGREPGRPALVRALEVVGRRFTPLDLPMVYQYDQDQFIAVVHEEFGRYETPAHDARIRAAPGHEVWIESEQRGQQIDIERAKSELSTTLAYLRRGPLDLTLTTAEPAVRASDLTALIPRVRDMLQRAPFILLVERQYMERVKNAESSTNYSPLSSEDVQSNYDFVGDYYQRDIALGEIMDWLEARWESPGAVTLGFSASAAGRWLRDLREYLDMPAQNAKFEMKDGKVTVFQSSQDGQTLDVEETRRSLESALIAQGGRSASAVIRTVRADKETDDVNALGIRERLGVGKSNFVGSPINRRHNIQVGVDAVNGTLIAPGDEFSLLKTLGEVNATAGYLPELVIKGNRTVPEYGGGLCQIGTTAFRASLSAGLPITERQNHSYRVRYYEPAGMDATIYSPKPDFRFLNDTGNYLLFQARTEGDEVIFELWGKNDGRLATTTQPEIFNIVRPPPAKIIETTDLKPGEKKCTEKPHSGADTVFMYTVIYPNGEPKKQEFRSHYRPWQEVCLVGVDEKPEGEMSNGEAALPSQDAAGVREE